LNKGPIKYGSLPKRGSPRNGRIPFAHKGEVMSKRKNKQTHNHQDALTKNHFELREISPLTPNQEKTFTSYKRGMNLVLHGYAGTGKSYVSLYLALEEVLSGNSLFDKVIIVRSVVPSRNIGFLPGSEKEKNRVYEEPYREICDDLFGRGDGYDILKMKNLVKFATTSFLRGTTFRNSIVIVDEIQNMTFPELDTVMTRLGDQSKIIFSGDYRQTDLATEKERVGLSQFLDITRKMNKFDYIEFEQEDIVRSGIVRDYIITRTDMVPIV